MSFDKEAQNWDQNPVRVKRARIFAEKIKNFIKEKDLQKALEFGSGTGLLSEQLKNQFESVTLVDTSEKMIDILKEKILQKKIKNFAPYHINIMEESLKENDFDMIYTLMTLHHIHDLDKIFQIFYSKLNTNGLLCIADLEKEDGTFHSSDNFDGHYGFNRKDLRSILKQNGFKEVFYTQPMSIDKNIAGKSKKYPLFLMIAEKIG